MFTHTHQPPAKIANHVWLVSLNPVCVSHSQSQRTTTCFTRLRIQNHVENLDFACPYVQLLWCLQGLQSYAFLLWTHTVKKKKNYRVLSERLVVPVFLFLLYNTSTHTQCHVEILHYTFIVSACQMAPDIRQRLGIKLSERLLPRPPTLFFSSTIPWA